MIFLFCAVFLIGIYVFLNIEAGQLKVRNAEFYRDYLSSVDFRAVFISDLHISRLAVRPEKIAEAIGAQNPDFVVFTGDFANSSKEKELKKALKFVQYLTDCAACPIYITYGNHDIRDIFERSLLREKDFTERLLNISPRIIVLDNSLTYFEKKGKKVFIGGLRDISSNKSDIKSMVSSWKKTAESENSRLCVISHNPDILLKMDESFADFFLAGHTHGGQIRLPFELEFTALRKHDKLAKQGIFYGKHIVKNVPVYITSGLGCSILPIRFGAYPEIVNIEIFEK